LNVSYADAAWAERGQFLILTYFDAFGGAEEEGVATIKKLFRYGSFQGSPVDFGVKRNQRVNLR
jgi:hypothetical protein